ncbi:class IV adenylate cyclase [Paludibaculum fermentans]|uniref:Class IV adenylate cyclase n=1 Tax=Paludibaculum fermentans TaxID=1473598 RepID=A0A7S7SNY8_PALFE|nr:class IV adenylate cyclase [Paludibaculum fermentans]QOY91433.1 class IV adenylate cyclase [Paludibaculum fermentans]
MLQSQPDQPLPRETEVKLAVPSAEAALQVLSAAGFVAAHERAFEANMLLDTPGSELMHTRRLLRLRDFRGETILTFKGPPEGGPHKTRPEVETCVADANAALGILNGLGYEVSFRYEKYRTTFARVGEPGHAVLDETPIGVFLELEGEASWIDKTAVELGFNAGHYVLKSYGSLFREYREKHSWHSQNMVFA